jgi:8-oxo-dGTP pyrophosphatase MutT (NUDIX family)
LQKSENLPGGQIGKSRKAYNITNNPGQPVFSGGRPKQGEKLQAGAVREFWEETGVNIAGVANARPSLIPFRRFNSKGELVEIGEYALEPHITAVRLRARCIQERSDLA